MKNLPCDLNEKYTAKLIGENSIKWGFFVNAMVYSYCILSNACGPWRIDLKALMTISSFILLSIINTLFSSAEYFQAVSGECTTPTSTTITGSVADCEVMTCIMKCEDFCQQKYHILELGIYLLLWQKFAELNILEIF